MKVPEGIWRYNTVPESCGVWLVTTQKPISRLSWWKGKFALFQMMVTGGGRWTSVQRPTPPTLGNQWGESFYRQKEGATSENQHSRLWQFSSVDRSCPTPCNPMACSTPGFPVHHHLPELTQTHIIFSHLQSGHWWSGHPDCFRYS